MSNTLDIEKHVKYFKRCLNALPSPYAKGLANHLSLTYFVISGLDLLGKIDEIPIAKKDIIDWVYSRQIIPSESNPDDFIKNCGFRGANFLGQPYCGGVGCRCLFDFDMPSIANTYCALAILRIVGDDFGRVNRDAITRSLKLCQQPDGSYVGTPFAGESDMRHLYAACVCSFMMDDWRGIDRDAATKYILASQNYEYGFAQVPGQEAHGGSTYCAVASLSLMGRLDLLTGERRDKLVHWLANKQITGYSGRINKDPDTCYSFWVGATLAILNETKVVDQMLLRGFIYSAQDPNIGGIAKIPQNMPDLLHSYMSLSGLTLLNEPNLRPLNPSLGISQRAAGENWNKILIN
ncbi:hypothetical protein PPL_11428 [Heterostelium album PN500]|uniref:Geranylgeranyl transferase type-1 subunit beta n=1 Tax=Heterostelium pallidum (strain ATCC 26659 / Pp 5 / PN500) TaxID=670386 RepID=D3BTD4_HETP5|nr:hypothetical protein PPL_11428 [Heterostelium album PN500]EFA75351.1 hypothetical protein PPL_11428 [Heterostelium album PN500]|eukprot:XP_020427485.1 hypothetical protein PPL_11428 [Heterostelium album PN500]